MHSTNWFSAVRVTTLRALVALLALSTQALALEYGEWLLLIEYDGSNHGFADGERLELAGAGIPGDTLVQTGEFEAGLGGGRIVTGLIDGEVTLTLGEDGFSVDLAVSSLSECVDDGIGTCARSLTQNGEVEMLFTAPEDGELHFSGTWAGSDGQFSIVDFFSLELVRITGNPFNPQELVVINTNNADEGTEAGTVDEIVLLEAGETYQLRLRNQTESGDGLDQGSASFSGIIVGTQTPVAGAVEDVSLITVICRNLVSGQSVTATPMDGSSWNCTDAGLSADAGDRVLQIAVGTASCETDPCTIGGTTTGVDGLVTVCRNLLSGDSANTQIVDGGWTCPLALANGEIALQIVVGDAPADSAAPRFH